MISVRVFALDTLTYIKSIYDTNFYGAQYFLNPNYNYLIYVQKYNCIFMTLDLNTMQYIALSLPAPSTDYQSINYRFFFLDDKQTYIFLNSNLLYIGLYDQKTHQLINKISLSVAFFPYSDAVIDQVNKLIFFYDTNNCLNQYSYSTNNLISQYQLNQTDSQAFQKRLIWDSYKQRIILSSNFTVYLINTKRNNIELYQVDTFVTQLRFFQNRNIIQYSTYYQNVLLDYDYLLNNNQAKFPTQINPRFFQVNNNTFLLLNDINSQANLFINQTITSTWMRNNLNSGYIRIVENDLQNLLIYAIFDNEIAILDLSNSLINQIDQLFLAQNIIKILFENQDQVILLSQSQQVLQLQKRQKSVKINEIIVLKQGIAQYLFANNLTTFLFTDFSGSQKNLNIVNLSYDSSKSISGNIRAQIVMPSRILSIQQLSNSQVVILMNNLIKIYDYILISEIVSVGLEFNVNFGNILIDSIYKRIFLQNHMVGSLVYDFNLQKHANSFISSFSTNLYFDDNFIYSVVSHFANIYFRQDLKLLFNFRYFNSTLELKNIRYLGVGYFFLVEFITKLSVYEFSPFVSLPTEKAFLQINQFSIIAFSFVKIQENENSSNEYQLNINGFTLEGMFLYRLALDIYSQQQTQSCSLNYQLQQFNYQDDTSLNQMSSYLISQQRKLKGITINISKYQNLYLPKLQQNVLNNIFQLIIAPKEQNIIVYIKDPFNIQQGVSFIQIKNLEMQTAPQNYQNYLQNNDIQTNLTINNIIFPDIKQVLLENITLTEASVQINNVQTLVIQKINLQHYENQTLPTITQINITNISMVIITEVNLISCKFNLGRPLIVLQNIEKLQINNINVINCDCSGFDQLLLINQVQNVTLKNIQISQTNFIQQSSFVISSTQFVNIQLLSLYQIIYNNQIPQLRQFQTKNTSSFIQKIFYFSNNKKVNIDDIQINDFNINSSNQFSIFDFELVYESLSINKSSIQNVNIQNDQDGTIFTNLGVCSTYLQSIQLQQIKNMRYLLLSSYQVSDIQIILCKNLTITNLKVNTSQIVQQSFIQITSDIIILDQIQFTDINVLLTDALQQFSLINLAADESILLQNSNFSSIENSLSSTILVQNSQNVNILNTIYQQLSTNGPSSSALKILDSQNVIIMSNAVSQCQSLQGSGAIQIINCKQVTIQKNTFSQISSKKGNGGVIYIQNSQISSFEYNLFTSNTATLGSGGAIYCENSNFNIFNSNQYIKNQALQGSGGAVLLNNCDILKIQNNTFNQNLAFIGGGIRYINLQPLVIMQSGVSFLKKNNQFYKNNATSYGINVGSYPKFLNMKNKNNQALEQNILDNVQSGYKSPIPILIRFIDEEMREVSFVNLQLYPQLSQDILEEMSIYILQAESSNIGLLGDLRQVYSLTHFAFIFDLSYSYQPSSSAILNIKSAQLLPQFQTDIQQVIQSRYNLPITVNFRKCQIGEILQQSGNYTLCYECGQGFYSIIDPYSAQSINCKRCPVGSIACQSSQIQVQNGYWRTGNLSDVIIQCQQSQFCIPEDPQSKNGCLKGHIGPICYECDVNGEIWGTQYSKSNQVCNDCVHFYSALNIILIFLIFAFILIQIYTKINNEMVLIRKYIMAKYLSKLRFVSPNLQRTQTSQSSFIKILINYFQFLGIVNSLNITLPTYFTFFNLTGGDTSQITIYSIDCLLFSKNLAVPNYIVRLLWINFQPIALFIVIQLFSYIFEKNTSHSSRQAVYTNIINIYLFFQPSVVKVITQSLSCQEIGSQSYISSDLNYTCLEREHMKYIYICILPLGLIWIVLIPLFLFVRIRNYKQKMHTIKILFRYGYLYQEYVDDKYYWDLARLIIRSTGIIAINIFNFQITFKSTVLFGVMFLFLLLQKKLKPFILQKFNNLEQESTFLVIITIYLLFVGSLSDNYIISYIVTFIIGILNFQFVLKMLQLILIQSIPAEEKDRNIFQKLIFKIKQKFPSYFQWIKIGHSYNCSPFKNWKKVSEVMKTIKEELNQNEFSFRQKISLSTAGNRISLGMSQILKKNQKLIKQNSKDSLDSHITTVIKFLFQQNIQFYILKTNFRSHKQKKNQSFRNLISNEILVEKYYLDFYIIENYSHEKPNQNQQTINLISNFQIIKNIRYQSSQIQQNKINFLYVCQKLLKYIVLNKNNNFNDKIISNSIIVQNLILFLLEIYQFNKNLSTYFISSLFKTFIIFMKIGLIQIKKKKLTQIHT
ncbi:transmembrane protein, putative (macronuclear) [Tetrahymena thermophila SB210]|uniref:Transmembrane protein, putative n=1 Tax=Tetrahymena thermophila (strain SB210) TaxID=312017 RepID=Q234F8_TETTS|nr:transmembrane protein, putative [Tetrahymena thermophila SB210]EAR92045.3 transmembrane protein, putative [Tetrahymena thermophila SB210]|eukprot:XP_001012290.3 transmembrane protein, putative [Tetrahymena thermophila SB210]